MASFDYRRCCVFVRFDDILMLFLVLCRRGSFSFSSFSCCLLIMRRRPMILTPSHCWHLLSFFSSLKPGNGAGADDFVSQEALFFDRGGRRGNGRRRRAPPRCIGIGGLVPGRCAHGSSITDTAAGAGLEIDRNAWLTLVALTHRRCRRQTCRSGA